MESLPAGVPAWQVLGVSGRQTGGRFSTLAGQKVDEWGWAHGHFDLRDWRACQLEALVGRCL